MLKLNKTGEYLLTQGYIFLYRLIQLNKPCSIVFN